MINLIRYDLKRQRKFLMGVALVAILAMVGSFFLVRMPFFLDFMREKDFTDIILISSIVVLLIGNIFFLGRILYRDFFTSEGYFTFSLPVGGFDHVMAKIIEVGAFYLLTSLAFSVVLACLGFVITIDFIFYLAHGFVMDIFLTLVVLLAFSKIRFEEGFGIGKAILLIGLIFLPLVLITNFFALVLVGDGLEVFSNMGLAFIYPFANGEDRVYKILTPIIYYFVVACIMVLVDSFYLRDNVNLI
ncbi:hypothetical protein [Anaerococcus sp. AGMB09787]|uniref:hypothetical protein n=1 Tax=Anaerococcus sp. AGMB09787 TaxID=2922869 RepID=UPI001FAEF78B|nr:hypothetical protein [Anaerococcus sp. AGMB09787]